MREQSNSNNGSDRPVSGSPQTGAARILLDSPPFVDLDSSRDWIDQGIWPAEWITVEGEPASPCRLAFRLPFVLAGPQTSRIHVAGDERYELFLDGELIGWGSERGTVDNWHFDSYDLCLEPGPHLLAAIVSCHGIKGMRSQVSLRPSFLLASESEGVPISSGRAGWEGKILNQVEYVKPFPTDFFSIGWNTVCRGDRMDWEAHRGTGQGWSRCAILHPGSTAGRRNRHPAIHLLTPAILPVAERRPFQGGRVRHVSSDWTDCVQEENHLAAECEDWQLWWSEGHPLTLPPDHRRRVLIDLEDYVCAWPELIVSGGKGARLQIFWAESLFCWQEGEATSEGAKGDRSAVEGKWFSGVGDTFVPDGGEERCFTGPFIRAGRYLELRMAADDEAVVLHGLKLLRAEYPLEITSRFETDSSDVRRMIARCQRTLRASCHDSIIDGPYYEQMGWLGDTPQTASVLCTATRDDRLVRKALVAFNASRLPAGLTRAQWPSRNSVILPGQTLIWIGLLHGFAWWRNDAAFVRSLLPGQRAILDYFLGCLGTDNCLRLDWGWCFADWVPGWRWGNPPVGSDGVSALFQWHLVMALQMAGLLEQHFGEPEFAARNFRRAAGLARAAEKFWNEDRGLYSDTAEQGSYCEHVQAMAILSGQLSEARRKRIAAGLTTSTGDITRTTISFSHYLFEAYHSLGAVEEIWRRLAYWFGLEDNGFLTTPEAPEPSRSDCHGWGAHPHYHLYASILGIRPASPGFRSVRIQPYLGPLKEVDATLPHPDGEIRLRFRRQGISLTGEIDLPPAIGGELIFGGVKIALHEGINQIPNINFH